VKPVGAAAESWVIMGDMGDMGDYGVGDYHEQLPSIAAR
jgi:hypothetical protein